MNIKVKIVEKEETLRFWDKYVTSHANSNLYQLSCWKKVIEKTYGHKTYYLAALSTSSLDSKLSSANDDSNGISIVGILPLVHMKHFIFGNKLVSIPFFDMGGLLTDSVEAEMALTIEAMALGKKWGVNEIELRHAMSEFDINSHLESLFDTAIRFHTHTHKVRMILDLPDSSETLLKSFKSKLRSQIKRPLKAGLYAKIGGYDLIDDFYSVFCVNMRDLGSPVHSKRLIENVLEIFQEKARIVIIYKDNHPIACSLLIGFLNILENPWASSLRGYSRLSPNMLLYWTMLEYACDNGYTKFDFGRSTPDEGTYNFKKQWGANPQPLFWQVLNFKTNSDVDCALSEKSKFDKAIHFWKFLPVPTTRFLGPLIRKHISL